MSPGDTGITVDDTMDGPRLVLYPDGTPVPGLDDGIGQTYAAVLWWKDGAGRWHLELFRDWISAWARRDRRVAGGMSDITLGKFMVIESGFGGAIDTFVARGDCFEAAGPGAADGMGWPVWVEVAVAPGGSARALSGTYATWESASRAGAAWARVREAGGGTTIVAVFDMAETLIDDISGLYRDSLQGSRATVGEAVRG